MKLELNSFTSKIKPMLNSVRQHINIIFIVSMLIIFGFLVLRINQYSNQEPSEDAINEKLEKVNRPKINDELIDKISQLQDQNVEVKSLFEAARNNPFSE